MCGLLRNFGKYADATDLLAHIDLIRELISNPRIDLQNMNPAAAESVTSASIPHLATLAVSGVQATVRQTPFLIGSAAEKVQFVISSRPSAPTLPVHCSIDRDVRGSWILENFDGITFVNGSQVDPNSHVAIRPTSVITIGSTDLTFFPEIFD